MLKYKWVVCPVPTGPYRSFQRRAWPSAELPDGTLIAYIACEDAYRPASIKAGTHSPLTLKFYDISNGVKNRKGMRATQTFSTLADAKIALAKIVKQHPEFFTLPK